MRRMHGGKVGVLVVGVLWGAIVLPCLLCGCHDRANFHGRGGERKRPRVASIPSLLPLTPAT